MTTPLASRSEALPPGSPPVRLPLPPPGSDDGCPPHFARQIRAAMRLAPAEAVRASSARLLGPARTRER